MLEIQYVLKRWPKNGRMFPEVSFEIHTRPIPDLYTALEKT